MLTPRPCREQDSHRMHKTGPRLGLFPCRYRRSYPLIHHHHANHLPQPPGLTLRLEQAEDVVLADWLLLALCSCLCHLWLCVRTGTLDVADDASGGVVHELDAALGNTTAGACPCQILLFIQLCVSEARARRRTGAAENAGDLDELDGDLGGIHDDKLGGSTLEQF